MATLCFLTGSAFADTPPTVAIPATATPAVVTTKTAALSVLGADDLGATKLVYTWSTSETNPVAPTYNRNGNNAAKSVTATFKASGNYTFQVAIKDNAGQAVTSSVPVVVQQTPTSMTLTPATLRINPGASQTFVAAAKDQFAKAMTPPASVTFTVTGGGTVSTSGEFAAAATPGTYTLTAISGVASAKASIVVNAAPTITTPASVTSSTVTGTFVNASVLASGSK